MEEATVETALTLFQLKCCGSREREQGLVFSFSSLISILQLLPKLINIITTCDPKSTVVPFAYCICHTRNGTVWHKDHLCVCASFDIERLSLSR